MGSKQVSSSMKNTMKELESLGHGIRLSRRKCDKIVKFHKMKIMFEFKI